MSNWKNERDAAHATGDGWGVWLLDKHMEPVKDLRHGLQSLTVSEAVNSTSVCKIELLGDHPAVELLLPLSGIDPESPELTWRRLVDEAQWIMAEGPGGEDERLTYRVHRITDDVRRGEHGLVAVESKSLYRYVEKIACRADPGSDLWIQLRYRDFRHGDALRVIKEFLMVNLMREFQPNAVSGWDLWSPGNWSSVNPSLWPAMVSPVHDSLNTVHTVLDARFDMAADLFAETLSGAGLMLTVDLWLEGDRQPAPAHVTLRRPTIWIDVKARQFDTSTSGPALDLLRGLVRMFDREANAPVLGLGTTRATHAGRLPWVVWRPEDMVGVTSAFTVVKSEDSHVTVGGRSPEVINKMVGVGAKSIFQGLAAALAAAIPIYGPLIAAAGTFLGEVVGESMQDKLFAWSEFTHSVRRAAHGRFAYRDQVASGDGWTLSAWQQGFQMLQQGAGMISVAFTADTAVYKWGRHYRAGDQQGVVHRGLVFATYVAEATLSWRVGKGWTESVTLGDPRAIESVARNHARSLKAISNAVERKSKVVL